MKMAKKATIRAILGGFGGIAISHIILIIISLAEGNNNFYVAHPLLIEKMNGELNAVIFQTILSYLYGAGFAASSCYWEMEKWSITRQTITYLTTILLVSLPISYFNYWFPHTVSGWVMYVGIFLGIFIIIWLYQYFHWKSEINDLNSKIK